MRKFMIPVSTLLIVCAVYCLAGDEKTAPASADEAAVREVVDKYFKGVINADRDLLGQAFATEVADLKYIKDKGHPVEMLKAVPINTAFTWWTQGKAKKSSGKVLALDIVDGEMAHVKFEFLYDNYNYIDFLTLYKVKGEWKLVGKVFVNRTPLTPEGEKK